MPRQVRYPGLCAYCGTEVTRATASKHFAVCPERKVPPLGQGRQRQSRYEEDIYYLRAEAAHLPEFWLNLEVNGYATLQDLDDYLRAIWLECCGHLSAFTLAGFGTPELAKEGSVDSVFRHKAKIMHVYDFGTSSWTTLKRVAVRQGQPATKWPIALMVRNRLPGIVCIECGAPAQWLCMDRCGRRRSYGVLMRQAPQDPSP